MSSRSSGGVPQNVGVRRRRIPVEPLRKATFQLESSVIDEIKAAVENGAAPSANVFVEDAVKARLRALRRIELYRSYATAAEDQQFQDELSSLTGEFESAIDDGLRASRPR